MRALPPASRLRRRALCAMPILLALTLTGCAGLFPAKTGRAPAPFDHTYNAWGMVLAHCAGPYGFDYAKAKEFEAQLAQARTEIAKVEKGDFALFTREQQIAYLINAHNIGAVARVLPRYPVGSIRATDSLGIPLHRADVALLGGHRSLKGIRGELMSRKYHEPRAIFLLNWAMTGCAPLPPVPATGENLNTLLENQTRRFIRNGEYNAFSRKSHHYILSPLLKWNKGAIEREYTTLRGFLRHFAGPAEVKAMELYNPKLVFDGFDESLNDRPMTAQEPTPTEKE